MEEILSISDFIINNDTNKIINKEKTCIELYNVSSKLRNGKFKIKDISVNIIYGDKVLIVGENGSGKSTFLDILSGRYPIETDNNYTFKVLGNNYTNPHAWININKNLLYLSRLNIKWHSTVYENLLFVSCFDESKIISFETFLNLNEYKNYLWNELSDGYKTRFLLVYGLLKFPKILIFDEPFGPLDENSLKLCLELLSLDRYNEITVIFTAQSIEHIEKISTLLLIFDKGECKLHRREEFLTIESNIVKLSVKTKKNVRTVLFKYFEKSILNIVYSPALNLYTIKFNRKITQKQIIEILLLENIEIDYFKNITNSFERYLQNV